MDVEHPAVPFFDEAFAQYPHISRKRDISRPRFDNVIMHYFVMVGPLKTNVGLCERGDAFGLCQFQAFGVGIVAGDQNNFIGAVRAFCGI